MRRRALLVGLVTSSLLGTAIGAGSVAGAAPLGTPATAVRAAVDGVARGLLQRRRPGRHRGRAPLAGGEPDPAARARVLRGHPAAPAARPRRRLVAVVAAGHGRACAVGAAGARPARAGRLGVVRARGRPRRRLPLTSTSTLARSTPLVPGVRLDLRRGHARRVRRLQPRRPRCFAGTSATASTSTIATDAFFTSSPGNRPAAADATGVVLSDGGVRWYPFDGSPSVVLATGQFVPDTFARVAVVRRVDHQGLRRERQPARAATVRPSRAQGGRSGRLEPRRRARHRPRHHRRRHGLERPPAERPAGRLQPARCSPGWATPTSTQRHGATDDERRLGRRRGRPRAPDGRRAGVRGRALRRHGRRDGDAADPHHAAAALGARLRLRRRARRRGAARRTACRPRWARTA